ncbi:MAG: Protoporphyrinogen oxidase [Candidatus Heimdallarchaeota archaeon LC_2]|nr:MAG: Protoporphyrinogen oxidase [Candidatus Heimdallarchaeota archaeon LC_2]
MSKEKKYKIVIVGSGISGLTIANELIASGYEKKDILVLESENRHGGLINSLKKDGYLCEQGPEGLRGNSDNSYRLFELADKVPIEVSDESKVRYLVHKGKLKKVPSGPISAITSPLIPFFGKLRIFREPFVKKKLENETIEQFMKRRLGKGILPIIDAFVSGIHGGDHTNLSIEHAFTTLKEYERSKGSIIRGALSSSKAKKKANKEKGIKKSKKKKPFLITSDAGMNGLIDGLANKVNIEYSEPVTAVEKEGDKFVISTKSATYSASKVIVATGVNGTQSISIMNETKLEKVLESYVTIVSLGFDESAFEKPIEGYGFLSPSKENTFVMGVLFTSRLFAEHAPKGKVHLRCFIGGARHPERASMAEEQLISNILSDLQTLVKVNGNPDFVQIMRNTEIGIPQMQLGHEKYVNWKNEMESKHEGLYLMGVGWNEISCSGLINEAMDLVEKLTTN